MRGAQSLAHLAKASMESLLFVLGTVHIMIFSVHQVVNKIGVALCKKA